MTKAELGTLKIGDIVRCTEDSLHYTGLGKAYTKNTFYVVRGKGGNWNSIQTIDNKGTINGWGYKNFEKLSKKEQEMVQILFKVVE